MTEPNIFEMSKKELAIYLAPRYGTGLDKYTKQRLIGMAQQVNHFEGLIERYKVGKFSVPLMERQLRDQSKPKLDTMIMHYQNEQNK